MPEIFRENLLACQASMYRFARSLSHDPNSAEELVQEAYRRALAAKTGPPPATLETTRCWLFAIVRHLWHNELRRRNRQARAISAFAQSGGYAELPDAQLTRRLLQSEVRQAIECLPDSYREVVLLRDIEGLSYVEIAEVLACPAGTVMSRLSRARELLRIALRAPTREPQKAEQKAGA